MPGVYDQRGRYLGDYVPQGTIGGDIWEFFHPGTVQAEDTAIGQTPPTTEEILTGAATDTVQQAGNAIVSVVTDSTKYIVLLGAAYLAWQMFKGK